MAEPFSRLAKTDVRLRFQIIAPASRGRNRKVLFSTEIDNPDLNEPIDLGHPSSLELPYNTPLAATIQVLRGDASVDLSDAILTLRFKPRRT